MITTTCNIIEVEGDIISIDQYLDHYPKSQIVVNLTMHELTEEQVEALQEYDLVITPPRGRVFTDTQDRIDWTKAILKAYPIDGRTAFIVGGDTAAFMMLVGLICSSVERDSAYCIVPNLAHFLYAQTERLRDNDRFIFKFQGWGKFSI